MATATISFRFLAIRLACDLCGEEARIASDAAIDAHLASLSEAGSAWIASHIEPRIVAVEATANGVEHEWVPR